MLTIKELSVSKKLDQNDLKNIKGGLTYTSSKTKQVSKVELDTSWQINYAPQLLFYQLS